jgi:hypothetical protein
VDRGSSCRGVEVDRGSSSRGVEGDRGSSSRSVEAERGSKRPDFTGASFPLESKGETGLETLKRERETAETI